MSLCRTWFVWRFAAVVALGLLTTAGTVTAQAMRLLVVPVANSAGLKHHQKLTDTGATTESAFNRTATLRVTVNNLQSAPADCLVEWQFLAKDLATRQNYVYDHGTNQVALNGGASTTFDVQSKPLGENDIQKFDYDEDDNGNPILIEDGNRKKSGAKPAGYVFLLKVRGKLIAVEVSDSELKEPYQKELTANTSRLHD